MKISSNLRVAGIRNFKTFKSNILKEKNSKPHAKISKSQRESVASILRKKCTQRRGFINLEVGKHFSPPKMKLGK